MAKRISVKGVVQGVGFRPFVYGLATRLNLHGWVCSSPGGVEILIDGQVVNIETFLQSLPLEKPAPAQIEAIRVAEAPPDSSTGFEIRDSQARDGAFQAISPDLGICPDCERELFNPKDRRYLYPFISCARCGPRFTVIKDVPYDRSNTTMGDFSMCDRCRSEYTEPTSRHFHAQSLACPNCGPFVELRETHSQFPTANPRISSIEIRLSAILKARRLLREGYIVAIKGLGGFHLACDASNPYTLAELRDRKGRVDKPFAVMAANLTVVNAVCELGRQEQRLLAGPEKPVVLLAKKKQAALQPYRASELVAPNLDSFGVMLPYTPLHHLLLNQTDPVLAREPVPPILVMTSSNFSEEPIATDNKQALQRLSPLADAFLLHNREIHIRSDDSVAREDSGHIVYLRRSRGYAPYPLKLHFETRPTLAVGGELKNVFCLTRDRYAFLSHHIGDIGNVESHRSFEQGIQHLSHVFRVRPEIMAHDLHPGYFTTHYARHSSVPLVGVQHHHAHIVSCMVDNGLEDRQLIGLAFDGAGYGADGKIWGGEALLASFADFERFAHLEYLPSPDDSSALCAPWRISAGYAHALGVEVSDLPFLQNVDKAALRVLREQLDRPGNSSHTSSMGRLFDAVAGLIGVRNEVSYEAQAALEMEVLSRPFLAEAAPYPYLIEESKTGLIVRLGRMLESIADDVRTRQSTGWIGARFHQTIAAISLDLCQQARLSTGLKEVALSGGVWQNRILLHLTRERLAQAGFVVYFHQQVPANDGGLSLGQAVVANHLITKQFLSVEARSA